LWGWSRISLAATQPINGQRDKPGVRWKLAFNVPKGSIKHDVCHQAESQVAGLEVVEINFLRG
jgi:hypothetical protein